MNTFLRGVLKLRNHHFLVIDTIFLAATPLLALILRLDGSVDLAQYISGLAVVTVVFLIIKLTVFLTFGFYKRCWRYASIDELIEIAMLTAAAVILQSFGFYALYYLTNSPVNSLPRSLPLLDGLLSLVFIGGLRFSLRAVERNSQLRAMSSQGDRVLLVGAGNAGISLAQEMQRNPQLGFEPVAFIDDDPKKLNLRIRGLPVVGNRNKIPEIVRSVQIGHVIIAMPSVSGKVIREIVEICKATGVQTRTLPGMNEILNGRVSVKRIRDIRIEDLLRREPIQTDIQRVFQFIKGKRVLVTGAGGSIGSEICRQILKCCPAEIVLLGHGENSVFSIQQELEQVLQILKHEGEAQAYIPRLAAFIADLRFPSRLQYTFDQFRPQIVFHAAAHKHVPLMELNPAEAITNNAIGTKNLLDLALQYDVENFVMISTDKAVNPTSVMGASKRVAEMLVLQAAKTTGKSFVVVRFGNVLGSRGSVVPTFQRQITTGEPITITHPDICRYFMTIPEAVQLVLQAAVIGKGGEVFMLDMGQPVKIVDLAKDLIRLSGYEVGKDIDIVFTGLRPGEKLFEELFILGEQYEQTLHEKILFARNASSNVPANLVFMVEALSKAANQNHTNSIISLLKQLVPEYQSRLQTTTALQAEDFQRNTKLVQIGHRTRRGERLKTSVPGCSTPSFPGKNELQAALERQEFRLYYQPIMFLETGRINGFEALLRWQHPERGLISPVKFISAAEETGLIIPLGWWVLREVCYQLCAWQEQLSPESSLTISVNLSSKQLLQPALVQQIDKLLKRHRLNTSSLRLDIPESVIRENPNSATVIMSQLRALGVQLQVDNFGRSHSFYNRPNCFQDLLCELFDRLKIDRFLVSRIDNDSESLEIVHNIAENAHNLGMSVTAAGVETAEQLAQLRALGCEYGQGYFFSKPVEGEAVRTLIGA